MTESLAIQGRRLSPAELQGLRQWVGENPHWSRWRLSRELATRWDWRNGAGVLKDLAARTLLVKLAQRGLAPLILPWVKVPDLGSWILGQVAGRIGRDWLAK